MLISIEGICQSGKTTLINGLLRIYPNLVYVDLYNELDANQADSLIRLLDRTKRRASLQQDIQLYLTQGKHVIVESYYLWVKYMSIVNGVDDLHYALKRRTIQPDVTILLQIDVEEAYKRPGYCFSKEMEIILNSFYNTANCQKIDATLNVPNMIQKVQSILIKRSTRA